MYKAEIVMLDKFYEIKLVNTNDTASHLVLAHHEIHKVAFRHHSLKPQKLWVHPNNAIRIKKTSLHHLDWSSWKQHVNMLASSCLYNVFEHAQWRVAQCACVCVSCYPHRNLSWGSVTSACSAEKSPPSPKNTASHFSQAKMKWHRNIERHM